MQTSLENDRLALVVDELLMLIQESADYHRDENFKVILGEARRALVATHGRLQKAGNRYVVAMVGLTNVGKSTLLNALLGSDLAPRRNGPCTAAPIEFVHGSAYQVTVYFRHQLQRPSWPCDSVEAVHDRLSALADDAGAESTQSPYKVVVEAPNSLLARGLIIADTPGFGAAQAGNAQGSHEEALRMYLHDIISQVFWVVLAEQGIGKREKWFHDQFFADVCNDVVVTGSEDWSLQERERFRRRFVQCFGHRMPTFHFVSGLEGLRARETNDEQGLEAAGITLLETRIRELADPSGRNEAIEKALLQLADDLGFWLRDFGSKHTRRLCCWWRPDSWDRWTSFTSDNSLARQLTKLLEIPA